MKGDSFKLAPLKWSNRYLIALKLALGLLLVLLVVLLAVLRQNEIDEQRSTLIADVLWLEQSIGFHLEGNAEQLEQIARELANRQVNRDAFSTRAEQLLKNSPDIQQIIWEDTAGEVIDAIPGQKRARLGKNGLGSEARAQAVAMASKLGKTVYTDAYAVSDGYQFEVYSPVFVRDRYAGTLICIYGYSDLLKNLVPWWFAEKYQVQVLDGNGISLARKSNVNDAVITINHTIALDPPGFGTMLKVDAYRSSNFSVQAWLSLMILLLAASVLLSLWVIRGHVRRRLAAEQAQRNEYAFRKAMENSLTVGMRARDMQGRVTYANPAFCQMVGFSEAELIDARPPMPYWPPEEVDHAQSISDAVLDGHPPNEGFEIRLMRRDGTRFDALIYEAPLIDADGRQTGWMASIVDVTARKRAEELARQQQEKLQRTSRLVTMGELASSLAHELNQPLAAITSYNTGCLNRLESGQFTPDELREALRKLGVQAQRAGRIIRRVHDFVRKSEPKLAPCPLAEVADDSIALIESTAKLQSVRIERDIEPTLPDIMADRVMLEQVLLNLMRNAIEAMSDASIDESRRRLTLRIGTADGTIQLRVIDGGPGIPAELHDRLFTPFFSTKAEGMGMGLNICRSIIEFHRGRLWIEDNPTGGTIIAISLPLTQSPTP